MKKLAEMTPKEVRERGTEPLGADSLSMRRGRWLAQMGRLP